MRRRERGTVLIVVLAMALLTLGASSAYLAASSRDLRNAQRLENRLAGLARARGLFELTTHRLQAGRFPSGHQESGGNANREGEHRIVAAVKGQGWTLSVQVSMTRGIPERTVALVKGELSRDGSGWRIAGYDETVKVSQPGGR